MIPNSPNQGQKVCPKCQNVNPIAAQTCWSCGHIFRTQFNQGLPIQPPAAVGVPAIFPTSVPARRRNFAWLWVLGAIAAVCIGLGIILAPRYVKFKAPPAVLTAEFDYSDTQISRALLSNDSKSTIYDIDIVAHTAQVHYSSNLLKPVDSVTPITLPVTSLESLSPEKRERIVIPVSILSLQPDDLEITYSETPGSPRRKAIVRFTRATDPPSHW